MVTSVYRFDWFIDTTWYHIVSSSKTDSGIVYFMYLSQMAILTKTDYLN